MVIKIKSQNDKNTRHSFFRGEIKPFELLDHCMSLIFYIVLNWHEHSSLPRKRKKSKSPPVNIAIMSQSPVHSQKLRKNTSKINTHLQVLFPMEISYHMPPLHYIQIQPHAIYQTQIAVLREALILLNIWRIWVLRHPETGRDIKKFAFHFSLRAREVFYITRP